eukprot:905863-Pleurochrysis_carterae.AAC.1
MEVATATLQLRRCERQKKYKRKHHFKGNPAAEEERFVAAKQRLLGRDNLIDCSWTRAVGADGFKVWDSRCGLMDGNWGGGGRGTKTSERLA